MARLCVLTVVICALASVGTAATPSVTFHKDVLPILQKNCQTCHRPGEVAPFSLMSYTDARPWAKAIKAAVVSQKMPPWFADPKVGHFSNERRLTQEQIATLVSWADNGAPEGDSKDAPTPLKFVDGWNIKPDLQVEMPTEFHVPATGTIDYQYMLVKTNFPEDMWVVAAEMRPGNSKVVHHGEAWVRPPGASGWLAPLQEFHIRRRRCEGALGTASRFWGSSIPVWATKRSTSGVPRSSSPRAPISCLRFTILQSGQRRPANRL